MILSEDQRREIDELFKSDLEQQVRVIFFTQDEPSMSLPVHVEVTPCEYCKETEELLKELSEISDKIEIEVYDFIKDRDKVEQYGIDGVPALAVVGDKDYGIRYYGIPSGYEFSVLLDALINASKRHTRLSDSTRQVLAEIQSPVHMRVFVTPTWPHCPGAVSLAYQMAMENDRIKVDAIESAEFPDLAMRYSVLAVPKTVINERTSVEGAVPETALVEELRHAVGL